MSPAGGVGINLAIQDAVAAANLLAQKILRGECTTEDIGAGTAGHNSGEDNPRTRRSLSTGGCLEPFRPGDFTFVARSETVGVIRTIDRRIGARALVNGF